MQKFEHKVIETDRVIDTIKEWEKQGWEAVSMCHLRDFAFLDVYKVLFKRDYEELVP